MQSQRENIRLDQGASFRLLRWNLSLSSVERLIRPSHSVRVEGKGDHWHYHRECELTLIQNGRGTRFVADHIEYFEAGDLVLIGPNVPHYWHMREASAGLAVQWDFPLDHGIWKFNEAAPLQALLESARRGLHVRGHAATVARAHMEKLVDRSGFARLTQFFQVLATLVDASPGELRPLSDRPFSLSGTAEIQESMRRAVSYILAHYREPVNIPELLRLTGMSRATFARQFRVHAGKPFSEFRNEVRLQAVCQALRHTTEPVSNIAFNHGFNQLSFFNRLFRREFGLSPKAYRESKTNLAV